MESTLMRQQQGFSLIELLIAIAIISILAAIAIPAYQNYIIKARVTEGFHLAHAAQLAVAETILMTNTLPSHQKETGYLSPKPTKNVQTITIGQAGVISIQYTNIAGGGTVLFTPTLYPTGELGWHCEAGTLDKKYLPANCRG